MYCNNCDKEYTDDYKFCTTCGNELEEKLEKKICKNCGIENNSNNLYCLNCNNRLDKEDLSEIVEKEKKEKVNPKDLHGSAKVGYYTRKITFVTFLVYVFLAIALVIYGEVSGKLIDTSGDVGMHFFALFMLIVVFVFYFTGFTFAVSIFNIILPSIWIESKKRVGTATEVFRFIGLVIGYLLLYLVPIIVVVAFIIYN